MEFRRPYPNSGVEVPANGVDYIIYGKDTNGDGIADIVYAKNGRTGEVEMVSDDAKNVLEFVLQNSIVSVKILSDIQLSDDVVIEREDDQYIYIDGNGHRIEGGGIILKMGSSWTTIGGAIKNLSFVGFKNYAISIDVAKFFEIKNVYIDGEQSSNGIYLDSAKDIEINKVRIYNTKEYGIYLAHSFGDKSVTGVRIEDSVIESNNGYGIYDDSDSDKTSIYISHNWFEQNGDWCIYSPKSAGAPGYFIIDSNRFINTRDISIGGNFITITGNEIRGISGSTNYPNIINSDKFTITGNSFWYVGLKLLSGFGIVSSNMMRNLEGVGIEIDDGAVTIIGNSIEGSGSSGVPAIYVNSSIFIAIKNKVIGNTFRNWDTYVVNTQNPENVVVSGNVIYGCTNLYNGHGINGTIIGTNVVGSSYTKATGIATFTGDGTTTTFSVATGLVSTPSKYWMIPLDENAKGYSSITASGTYLVVNFDTALGSGSTATFSWYAEV